MTTAQVTRRQVAFLAACWVAFLVVLMVHGVVRGLGDEIAPIREVQGVEQTLFLVPVPQWLQDHLQSPYLLDMTAFIAYTFWFVLPVILALAITRKAPRELLPFFAWIAVMTALTDLVFLVFPVSPPWMHEGTSRILIERAFTTYTSADNNEFAAFPSLHAGLPLVFALFFFLRVPSAKKLGWLCAVYSVTVGASVVYLGEHWLLDVLGGYAFAGLTAWLCLSPRVWRLYRAIPGDPIRRMDALNRRVFAVEQSAPPADVPAPEELPEAA